MTAAPKLDNVKDWFAKNPQGSLWVPTQTRNEIIADQDWSSSPKFTAHGRVYRWAFKSIGGGMWEISLTNLSWKE